MDLTAWMLSNLPPEVIEDNTNPKLARRLADLAAEAWEEGARDGGRGLLPRPKRRIRNPYRENGEKWHA